MPTWLIVVIVVSAMFIISMLWRLRNIHSQSFKEVSQMRLAAHHMWEARGRREMEQFKDREVGPNDRDEYVERMVDHYQSLRGNGETHSGAIKRVNLSGTVGI